MAILSVLMIPLVSCGDSAGQGTVASDSFCAKQLGSLQYYTYRNVGTGQAIQIIGDRIYLLGDNQTGTIQELAFDGADYTPTGWIAYLTVMEEDGRAIDLINHPTGLAYREGYPTFIGNGGTIYSIDWDLLYEDKNLDRAILNMILINGVTARPEYVQYQGRWLVATANYDAGEEGNEMILMDPDTLKDAETVDDPGVILYRFEVPSLVQDLYWSDETQNVVLIRNVRVYQGWQLTYVDIEEAVENGFTSDESTTETGCFEAFATELEGYAKFPNGNRFFLTGDKTNNFIVEPVR